MGIEWVRSARTTSPIHLSQHDSTVREIISALVESQGGYEMKADERIVHVRPTRADGDKHDFLNVRIARFQLDDEYVAVGSRRLWSEVHWIVNPAEKRPNAEAGSIGIGNGDQKVSFQIAKATVRDVLDRLATSAGLNVWVVSYPEVVSYTSGGYRRTVSLFNDDLSDEQQPQWDLLPWGFDPVSKRVCRDWLEAAPTGPRH
jgi:hypothetical protein